MPYRDSVLTRLLQTSLGGNAKTHLLLTCSSRVAHVDETLSTLRFGARAKRVNNSPHVNVLAEDAAGSGGHRENQRLLQTLRDKVYVKCVVRCLAHADTMHGPLQRESGLLHPRAGGNEVYGLLTTTIGC